VDECPEDAGLRGAPGKPFTTYISVECATSPSISCMTAHRPGSTNLNTQYYHHNVVYISNIITINTNILKIKHRGGASLPLLVTAMLWIHKATGGRKLAEYFSAISPFSKFKCIRLLWLSLSWQQRTTQLLSHSFPLPGGVGKRTRREKAKLMGWDDNSLTEWQREKKIATNNTDKKHIEHATLSPPNAPLAPEQQMPLLQPAPHLNTEHDATWYRTAHLIGCLGLPNQLLVKINPIPAEPRTLLQL